MCALRHTSSVQTYIHIQNIKEAEIFVYGDIKIERKTWTHENHCGLYARNLIHKDIQAENHIAKKAQKTQDACIA